MALAHEETFDDSVMLLEKEGDFMIDEVSEKELLENNANSKQKDDILKKMMLEEDIEASAWNPASTLISNIKMDDLSAMDVMRLFYKSIFPFDKMYQWLTYGNINKNVFSRREFSFTLENDIYLRFQSFATEKEMREKIIKLSPKKIDIGAVYSARPSEKKSLQSNHFKPIEKEMVLDIDMTDYDDVRTCCQDKGICLKCWKFIVIAVKVLNHALKEDFGFTKCLWVFSGRRGVHCWIADERARKMDMNARKALISYLELIKGGAEQKKKVNLSGNGDLLHPMISRAIQTVEPIFTKRIILEQDIINSEEKIKKILTLLPDDPLKEGLYKEWTIKRKMSAKDRWEQLTEELDRAATSFSSSRKPAGTSKGTLAAYKHLKHEIMLQYCYPRLDANVSIQLNHLLKSPFCVHPATDKVCVPFRPEEVDTFDPESVPKVRELLKEIYGDTFTGELLANHPIKYEETSMAEAMEIFDTFLKALQEEQKLCANFQRQDEDAKMVY